MSHGLRVWDASGNLIFTTERSIGGVYLGTFSTSITSGSVTWTFDGSGIYPNVAGRQLRVMQVGAGAHGYAVHNEANPPYIVLTTRSRPSSPFSSNDTTTLKVFAA